MANRFWDYQKASLQKGVVMYWVNFTVGAAGAPTLNVPKSKGILSIVRQSAGRYAINFQSKHVDLLAVEQTLIVASGTPGAVGGMVVRSFDLGVAQNIIVEFVDGTGAATDLPSGATVLLRAEIKNTSIV